MRAIDVLGLSAGALTTFAFVPQVFKLWRQRPRPASDISCPMYVIFGVGVLCWLIYGIGIGSKPVIVANAVTLILSMPVLIYKWIYG